MTTNASEVIVTRQCAQPAECMPPLGAVAEQAPGQRPAQPQAIFSQTASSAPCNDRLVSRAVPYTATCKPANADRLQDSIVRCSKHDKHGPPGLGDVDPPSPRHANRRQLGSRTASHTTPRNRLRGQTMIRDSVPHNPKHA